MNFIWEASVLMKGEAAKKQLFKIEMLRSYIAGFRCAAHIQTVLIELISLCRVVPTRQSISNQVFSAPSVMNFINELGYVVQMSSLERCGIFRSIFQGKDKWPMVGSDSHFLTLNEMSKMCH